MVVLQLDDMFMREERVNDYFLLNIFDVRGGRLLKDLNRDVFPSDEVVGEVNFRSAP